MNDDAYREIFLAPIRECANYHPAFGREEDGGVTVEQFRTLYGGDPLYHWVGLDSELMYAAHKAAGGMTSIYRQLGIGCERLLRQIIIDRYHFHQDQVTWSYEYEKENKKLGTHTLDAHISLTDITDKSAATTFRSWLSEAGHSLGLSKKRVGELTGAVFEIRQGYKSADSKRQNADLRFGMRAANEDLLPVVAIASTQISEPVIRRYRNSQILVLLGNHEGSVTSTFGFYRDVVGYDLPGFFTRNSGSFRSAFAQILKALLSP